MNRAKTAIWVFMGLTFAASTSPAAVRTYELEVRAYCHEASTTQPCGHGSEADLESFFQGQMQLINLVWEPLEISFRLRDVIVTYDDDYADLETDGIDDETTVNGAKVKQLKQLAAQSPGVVTLFVMPGPPTAPLGMCWSQVAGKNPRNYAEDYYALFCAPFGDYSVLAHELGHHFCQPHTFTFQDPGTHSPVNHDGDGHADTPPDPGELEVQSATVTSGFDRRVDGTFVNDREWCFFDTFTDVDPGSQITQYCTSDCRRRVDDAFETFPGTVNMALAMSYYKHACIGGYVRNGITEPAFTPDGKADVDNCIATLPERKAYVDVCGNDDDTDGDGICNLQDVCPAVYSAHAPDSDGDGFPDPCDNCAYDPNADQADVDGDDLGDVCDPDIDNDDCGNGVDQHPFDSQVVTGTVVYPGCDQPAITVTQFEGDHLDNDADGVRDCQDKDDDQDGIPDDLDVCPLASGASCVTIGKECPPPWARADLLCAHPLCNDFLIRLVSVINPADFLIFERFSIDERALHLGRLPGKTVSETIRCLFGDCFGAGGRSGAYALELWSRTLDTKLDDLLVYDPSAMRAGEIRNGVAASIELGPQGTPFVEASWGIGIPSTARLADGDEDGWPDTADNCSATWNDAQIDSNGDGFGNACDADLDDDGAVTLGDLEFIQTCDGAQPGLRAKLGEPGLAITLVDAPTQEDLAKAYRCRHADLDGDAFVTQNDARLARAALTKAPGPSGRDTARSVDPAMSLRTLIELVLRLIAAL